MADLYETIGEHPELPTFTSYWDLLSPLEAQILNDNLRKMAENRRLIKPDNEKFGSSEQPRRLGLGLCSLEVIMTPEERKDLRDDLAAIVRQRNSVPPNDYLI